MTDLSDLYQELILDHSRKPHNFRKLEGADHTCEGVNPLCGDQITLYLKLEKDVIKDITFEGAGCAISKASASLMTDSVKQRTKAEVETLFDKFHHMVTGEGTPPDPIEMGKLAAFSGVSDYPARVKCASLAWHTLRAALSEKKETVSTEEPVSPS